jgi:hypothetical protein
MNSPLHSPAPQPRHGLRAWLLHAASHWPLYAVAGTSTLLLACLLAESAIHPEALALALFLLTGVVVDTLLAPGAGSRWLPLATALACHAAALLWCLALAGGALHWRRRRPELQLA